MCRGQHTAACVKYVVTNPAMKPAEGVYALHTTSAPATGTTGGMTYQDVAAHARRLGFVLRPSANNRPAGAPAAAPRSPSFQKNNAGAPPRNPGTPKDYSGFQCWKCGSTGHIRYNCPSSETGLKFAPPQRLNMLCAEAEELYPLQDPGYGETVSEYAPTPVNA